MSNTQNKIDELLKGVERLRDELMLKANLGIADAKDELDKFDDTYGDLKAKAGEIAGVAGDTASELRIAAQMGIKAETKEELDSALDTASSEIKKGYERIKRLI